MSIRTQKKANRQKVSPLLTGEDTTNSTSPKAPRRCSACLAAVQATPVSKGSEEILQDFESPQSDYTPSPYSKTTSLANWEPEDHQAGVVSPKLEAVSPGLTSPSLQVSHAEISEHDLQYSNSRLTIPYRGLEGYVRLGMEGIISNEENGNGTENVSVPMSSPQTPFPAYQQPHSQGNHERRTVISGDLDTSYRKEQKRRSLSTAQETSCGFNPAANELMPDTAIMNRIRERIPNVFEKRSYEEAVKMVAETRRTIYETLQDPFSAGVQSPAGQQIANVAPMPSVMSALGQHQNYLFAQGPANVQEDCGDSGQQKSLYELIYKQTASGVATQSSIERAYSDLSSSDYHSKYEKPHSCSPSPVRGVLRNLRVDPLEDEYPMPMDSCEEPGPSYAMDLLGLNQLQELNDYFHLPGVQDPVTVNTLMAADDYHSRYLTIQRLNPELAKAFDTLFEHSRGLYAETALVAALAEMLKIFGREHPAGRDAQI